MSGKIIVERPRGKFRDAVRRYSINIDDVRAAQLRAGSRVVLDVPAGTHMVQARLDWTSSPALSVEVSDGAIVSLIAEPGGTHSRRTISHSSRRAVM